MALTVTTPLQLTLNTFGTDVIAEFQDVAETASSSGLYYATIDCSEYKGDNILILLKNKHANTAKDAWILKGNGVGAPAADLAKENIEAANAKYYPVVVETAKYMQYTGDYAGKIVVKGESTDIGVAVIVLPSL